MARQSHLRKQLIVAAAIVVHIEAGTALTAVRAFGRRAQVAQAAALREPTGDAREATVCGGIATLSGAELVRKFGAAIVLARQALHAGLCAEKRIELQNGVIGG